MKTCVSVALAVVAFVVLAGVGDLLSEEIRARLDQLPRTLVRFAARLAADVIREEMREEWLGELHEYLRGAEAVPITRLVRGLRYAVGVMWVAPIMARRLGIPSKRARRRALERVPDATSAETTADSPAPGVAHDLTHQPRASVQPALAGGPLVGDDLTSRQRRIMEFIRAWVTANGYPPSVREIGKAVQLASPSSVAYQLRELERRGLLRRDRNRPPAGIARDLTRPLPGPRRLIPAADSLAGDGLTPRQRRIMEFIRAWVTAHGYPPSVREIGKAVQLVSLSSVAYQLCELERKGLLRRDPNRPPMAGTHAADV